MVPPPPPLPSKHTHTHTQYKYQLNIDGTVAAYRLPYLLAGGSLVLKQDSDYYEHFYHRLEPWVHYVPLQRDLSDVVEKVEWGRGNEERAQQMASHAFQFVQSHLLPEHLYCYIVRLLKVRAKHGLKRWMTVSGRKQKGGLMTNQF